MTRILETVERAEDRLSPEEGLRLRKELEIARAECQRLAADNAQRVRDYAKLEDLARDPIRLEREVAELQAKLAQAKEFAERLVARNKDLEGAVEWGKEAQKRLAGAVEQTKPEPKGLLEKVAAWLAGGD